MKIKKINKWIVAWFILTLVCSGLPALAYSEAEMIEALVLGFLIFGIIFGIFLVVLKLVITRNSFKKYPLERGESERLEVYWTYGFRNVTLKLDGNEIGILTSKDVKAGKTFRLQNGSELHIKVGQNPVNLNPVPDITLDGKPVPGSVNDPEVEIVTAAKAFWGGAFLNALAGIAYFSINPTWYTILLFGMSVAGILVGLFLRRRSRVALRFGVGLAVISVLSFIMALFASKGFDFFNNLFDLADAVLIFVGLFKGFSAIDQLEKESKRAA